MHVRSLSALLLAIIAALPTSSTSYAQSPSADSLTAAMRRSNRLISKDLEGIRTLCANQQKRKTALENMIAKNQPQLAALTTRLEELTETLRLKDADLRMKRVALATLRAEIAVLEDSIKNARTSTATRIFTLKGEIEAARKVAVKATIDIDRLDDTFEKWKVEGSNEFTLFRAQLKDENNKWLDADKRVPLTAAEQNALDTLTAYDTTRAELSEIKVDNEALAAQKAQLIADLKAGRRANVEVLKTQLAERQRSVGAALTATATLRNEVTKLRASLRTVNARIATLSDIVVPTIAPICSVIDELSTSQS